MTRSTAAYEPRRWVIVALLCAGCRPSDGAGPLPTVERGALSSGVVARVGAIPISAATVAAVAAAQGVTPEKALALEVADALLELAGQARGYDRQPGITVAVRGVLARARLELLRSEASAPEIQPSEVEEATVRHFVDLDRPETFRVVHAVVRLPEHADEAARKRGRTVAESLAVQVSGASSESDFRARADALTERGGFEVVVESLSPVAADGRVISGDPPAPAGRYDEPFARAAARLARVGDQSPVVTSSFGFHVMMLLERLAGHVTPYAERAALLSDEILTGRVRAARKHLVDRLRSSGGAVVERNAESLMASVDVAPHDRP